MLVSFIAAIEMSADDMVLPDLSVSHLGSFLWTFAGFGVGAKIMLAHSFVGDEILPLLRRFNKAIVQPVLSLGVKQILWSQPYGR